MDLEQIRKDFAEGKMISKCTWALVLQSTVEMENTLENFSTIPPDRAHAADADELASVVQGLASDCLGRVAAL